MDVKNLPKIDLHCHLDGSARPETLIEIGKDEKIDLPTFDLLKFKKLVTAPWECNSLVDYLKRFSLPLILMQSAKSLKRTTYELLEDAAKENVKYLEVRFAPTQHMKNGLKIEETIESVLEGMKEGEKDFKIKSSLILCCMKHLSEEDALKVIKAGRKYLNFGVKAVDLCGAEEKGFSQKFITSMRLAKEYGYELTIHAGESGFGENVLDAVELLNAKRIGHGVFIKDFSKAYDLVKEKGIFLEMCPTSNIQTKAVKALKEHPFYKFYKDGINVTINTDNRTVSNTNMIREISMLEDEFSLSIEEYKNIYLNSVEAAFISEDEKESLREFI